MKLVNPLLLPSVTLALIMLTSACGVQTQSLVDDFTSHQLLGRDLPDKTIALTFDDGPGERTLELAHYLHDRNIRATFFVVGDNAEQHLDVLQEVKSLGHLIGNHSQHHEDMTRVGDPIAAVRQTDATITPYVTGNMFLFRAPYGAWNAHVTDILNAAGLTKYVGSVYWDIGGEIVGDYAADWDCWGRGWSVERCGQGYFNEVYDLRRGISLMHDIHNQTVDMVKWLIPRLESNGYKFARLDEVPNIAAQIRQAGGHPGSDSFKVASRP